MSPTLPGNAAASINTVPSADGTTEEATAHITRGLDLFKAGKYNRAIAALDAGTEHKRFADLADVVQADAYASLGEAWLRYGVAGVEKPALTACEKAKNHRTGKPRPISIEVAHCATPIGSMTRSRPSKKASRTLVSSN